VRLSRKPVAASAEFLASAFVIRHVAAKCMPVVGTVAPIPQMDQFVYDDVIVQVHRCLDDAPVEADGPVAVAAPPGLLLIDNDDTRHRRR